MDTVLTLADPLIAHVLTKINSYKLLSLIKHYPVIRAALKKYKKMFHYKFSRQCQITDDDLKYLNGLIYSISLIECYEITDKSTKYMRNAHYVELRDVNMTERGLKNLKNLNTIKLNGFHIVNHKMVCLFTDAGIKYLKNVRNVYLSHCGITNVGLKYLKNTNLYLLGCDKITGAGLKYVKNIKYIDCAVFLSDQCLKYLKKAKFVSLQHNTHITREGLKMLKNIDIINLVACHQITIDDMKCLKGIKHIIIDKGTDINESVTKYFTDANSEFKFHYKHFDIDECGYGKHVYLSVKECWDCKICDSCTFFSEFVI